MISKLCRCLVLLLISLPTLAAESAEDSQSERRTADTIVIGGRILTEDAHDSIVEGLAMRKR
jgi:hypothetical protein